MPLRHRALLGCATASVVLFAAATSCVVHVTDDDGQGECEVHRDCPGGTCDFDTGRCVVRPSCTSASDCASGQVCSGEEEGKCVAPTQGNCRETYPDQSSLPSGKVFLVGLSADLTGPDLTTGISIANAAKLGVDVFNRNGGVGGTDPIVLVLCDDGGDSEAAADNARTLDAMGVSAMIGPTYSGQVLAATTTTNDGPGSVDNDLLVLSSGATNPLVTGIADSSPACVSSCAGDASCVDACPGLVWRTAPSDELQGRVLAGYFEQMEDHVKARGGAVRTTTRVAVLHGRGAYGEVLAQVLRSNLQVNGQAAASQEGQQFFLLGYDPMNDGSIDDSVISDAIALEPDAIFLIGTSEVGAILDRFENEWPGAEPDRPYYFFSDGGLSSDVADVARATGATQRVRGSIPGTQSSRFAEFALEYRSSFTGTDAGDPNIFGAAGAYDAVHLLAYAALATRTQPRTAEALARGFSRLVSGETVAAGPADVGIATSLLTDGVTFDFEGASGPLDYDLDTGDAPGDYQIWCIPSEDSGTIGTFTGIGYDAKLDEIVGTDTGEDFVCPSN